MFVRLLGVLFFLVLGVLSARDATSAIYDPLDPTMAHLELAAEPVQLGADADYPGMWEYVYDFYHAAGTWESHITLRGFEADLIANIHNEHSGSGVWQYWDRMTYGQPWGFQSSPWQKNYRPSFWSGSGFNWELPSEGACVGCANEAYELINKWHHPFEYHSDVFYGWGPGSLVDYDAGIAGADAVRFEVWNPGAPNQFSVSGLGITFRIVHPNAPGTVQWNTYHWQEEDLFGTIAGPSVVPNLSTMISIGAGAAGHTGGGSMNEGGVSVTFDNVGSGGTFSSTFDTPVFEDLASYLPTAAAASVNFILPGESLQVWDLTFDGEFTGMATVTLGYDESLLSVLEEDLGIFHFHDGSWNYVTDGFVLDTDANTITIEVDGFSPFMLGVTPAVPEPASCLLAVIGLLGLGLLIRRSRR